MIRALLAPLALLALLLLPEAAAAQAPAPFTGGAAITSPIIQGFVGAAQQVAQSFATRIAGEVLTLLNYAFLIWILLQVAQMMLGMSSGGGTFWNIVRRSAIYMILAFMLAGISSGAYWTWFVEEPIRISANVSAIAMSRGAACSGDAAATASCLARQIEMVFTQPMHASLVSMRATPFTLDSIVSGAAVSQFLAGALLMLVSFIGLVFFAFFILDVVLRILVLAMFSAIFVAAFLFNPTRGWATGAAWNLVGSMATLVGGAAVLGILEQTMTRTLGGNGWGGVVSQIAASGGAYDSPINLDRVVFWQALFLALVSVGVAKAISQMMASVFNSAPAGSPMADKVSAIAAIPAKGVVAVSALGAGALGYIGLRGAAGAARWGTTQMGTQLGDAAGAIKDRVGRIQFGPGPLGGGSPLGGGPGGGPGGSPGGAGPLGGGGGPGGGFGGGISGGGGSAFGPGFAAGGASSASGPTAQAGLGAAQAAATQAAAAAAGPTVAAAAAAAAGKAKKGAAAYKGAFAWQAAQQAGRDLGEAVDPMSRTGT